MDACGIGEVSSSVVALGLAGALWLLGFGRWEDGWELTYLSC